MKHTWITKHDSCPDIWGPADAGAGKPDFFARFGRFSDNIHNGPKCGICGFNFCPNCDPQKWEDDSCPGSDA